MNQKLNPYEKIRECGLLIKSYEDKLNLQQLSFILRWMEHRKRENCKIPTQKKCYEGAIKDMEYAFKAAYKLNEPNNKSKI